MRKLIFVVLVVLFTIGSCIFIDSDIGVDSDITINNNTSVPVTYQDGAYSVEFDDDAGVGDTLHIDLH